MTQRLLIALNPCDDDYLDAPSILIDPAPDDARLDSWLNLWRFVQRDVEDLDRAVSAARLIQILTNHLPGQVAADTLGNLVMADDLILVLDTVNMEIINRYSDARVFVDEAYWRGHPSTQKETP